MWLAENRTPSWFLRHEITWDDSYAKQIKMCPLLLQAARRTISDFWVPVEEKKTRQHDFQPQTAIISVNNLCWSLNYADEFLCEFDMTGFPSLTVVSRDVHLRRSHNNIPKARLRTLKMSIVIVTSFIICWTPYYLLGLWYWLFPEKMEETVSHSLTHMLFIFGLFNACLDPITYGLFTIHLHKGLRRCCHSSNTHTKSENNTCIIHMNRLSSFRHNESGGHNVDVDEGTGMKNRPVIPVSKIWEELRYKTE